MSLSYQTEHQAWKQRVNQEVSTAAGFLSTNRVATSAAQSARESESRPFQLHLSKDELKQSRVNLAYTFGGFTPARFAFKNANAASYSVYHTHDCGTDSRPHKSVGINTDQRPQTAAPQQRYIDELKGLVQAERTRREAVERKLQTHR